MFTLIVRLISKFSALKTFSEKIKFSGSKVFITNVMYPIEGSLIIFQGSFNGLIISQIDSDN